MKTHYIKATLNSPEIHFDVENNLFLISGQSILTNVQEFYSPIISWLEEYAQNPASELMVKFNLNYYNLASAKRFMFMIYLFSKMRMKGSTVKIEWRFFKDDEFMKEFGEDLAEHFDVPMTLLPSLTYRADVKMAS